MSYSDFTLQSIEAAFGVTARPDALFAGARPAPVPGWLRDGLDRGLQLPLVSEKARSELIVMPVLLACRELSGGTIAVYSGPRLDVSPELGLVGECDFLLARTPPLPEVRAPLVALVEARENDVESGLGPCLARMIGARLLNERGGRPAAPVFGCVTTGEVWQFLRLDGDSAAIDPPPLRPRRRGGHPGRLPGDRGRSPRRPGAECLVMTIREKPTIPFN